MPVRHIAVMTLAAVTAALAADMQRLDVVEFLKQRGAEE
jgi:hypothetical protein